jgi:hypothetical protein
MHQWFSVMRISFVIEIFRMNLDDLAADMARLPDHVITNFEFRSRDWLSSVTLFAPFDSYAVDIHHLSTKPTWLD